MYTNIVSRYLAMVNKLMAEPIYNFAEASSRDVPEKPGVYLIYDKRVKAIIYAGRTKSLRRRLLSNHKRGNVEGSQFRKALKQDLALKSEKEITTYLLKNCSFRFIVINEFEEIVRLEHFITAVVAPNLNIKLKQ